MVEALTPLAQTLLDALAWFLAGFLALAAAHKQLDRDRLGAAAAALVGGQADQAPMLLIGAAGLELALAVAMVIPETRSFAALGAALLWLGYGALVWRLRTRDAAADCGCVWGGSRATSQTTGFPPRNAVLATLAAGLSGWSHMIAAPLRAEPAALALLLLLLVLAWDALPKAPRLERTI
jgi:hypothetical protein